MTSTSYPLRIAFGDRARVGKDTSAEYLIKQHGGTQLAFATPLYESMCYTQDVFGIPRHKDRKFLHAVGDIGRSFDPDIFVKLLINVIPTNSNVYVSDVRKENEFHALKKIGFTMVRLVRDVALTDPSYGDGDRNHHTEMGLEHLDWDYVVDNNGSFEELYKQLDSIIVQTK